MSHDKTFYISSDYEYKTKRTHLGIVTISPKCVSCPNLPILHLHPPDHPYDDILMQVFQKL